jgi:Ca-activated chloride channel family protein
MRVRPALGEPAPRAAEGLAARSAGRLGQAETKPVPPGSFTSAAIILLTDGQTTTGPDPIEAAKIAGDRGVRVYTVGIGTSAGEIIGVEAGRCACVLDEDSLKTIANLTRGEYFYAETPPTCRRSTRT